MQSEAVLPNSEGEEKNSRHKGCAGCDRPTKIPAWPRGHDLVQSDADSWKQRGRNFRVGSVVKTGVDGGKEGLFLHECGTAGGAYGKVRAKFCRRSSAGGRPFD